MRFATYKNIIHNSNRHFKDPSSIFAADGQRTDLTYDARGRLLTAVERANTAPASHSFTYDVVGQMTSYTSPDGSKWDFTYNLARRLTEIESPDGETVTFTHDAMGNVTKTEYSNATGAQTFFDDVAYDELGRIMTLVGAHGQNTAFTYDKEDNLKTTTDPQSMVSTNSFDALNRLVSTVDRTSATTQMSHDDADQLTQFTDPRGIVTSFTYNGFGEVVQEVSADRGTISYSYNERGLPSSMTDGRGVVTNYTYDNGGRLKNKIFPSDNGLKETISYRPNTAGKNRGKLSQIKDKSGRKEYGYTNDGFISSVRHRIDGVRYDFGYRFNNDFGTIRRVIHPSGLNMNYTYDDQGRISRLKITPASGSNFATVNIQNFDYLPFGPLLAYTHRDGATHTRSYDSSYRLTGLFDQHGGVTLRNNSLAWTNRDNLASATDMLNAFNTEVYQYTAREKLSQADGPYDQCLTSAPMGPNRVIC